MPSVTRRVERAPHQLEHRLDVGNPDERLGGGLSRRPSRSAGLRICPPSLKRPPSSSARCSSFVRYRSNTRSPDPSARALRLTLLSSRPLIHFTEVPEPSPSVITRRLVTT